MTSFLPRLLLAALFAALAAVLGWPNLWLDEVLQLVGTLRTSFGQMLAWVATQPGGGPLGYLVQWAALAVFGFSSFTARLPALAAAAVGCVLLARLAARCGAPQPWGAAVALAILPIHVRYAIEARPYSLALALSILATLLFLRTAEAPRAPRAALYAASLAMCLYTQPFSAFVAGGHLLWALRLGRRKVFALGLGACAAAGLAFLPWFLHARGQWQQSIGASGFVFRGGWIGTPLLLLREITGAGFAGTAILLAAAFAGARRLDPAPRLLLLTTATVPVAAALLGDFWFGYFLAIRQFLWIVPPLAILAAAGLSDRRSVAGAVAALALAYDVRVVVRPRENWPEAARAVVELAPRADCIAFVPPDAHLVYGVFAPGIGQRACGPAPRGPVLRVTVPQATAEEVTHAARPGWTILESAAAGGSRLELLTPPAVPAAPGGHALSVPR